VRTNGKLQRKAVLWCLLFSTFGVFLATGNSQLLALEASSMFPFPHVVSCLCRRACSTQGHDFVFTLNASLPCLCVAQVLGT
jgi:hypothetical protein